MATGLPAQFEAAKNAHPNMLLLFHEGDYYNAYAADAETIGRVLGLTVCRTKCPVPMSGFCYHVLETYLRKLLTAGHRVAICENAE